jgi:hypothetical protein
MRPIRLVGIECRIASALDGHISSGLRRHSPVAKCTLQDPQCSISTVASESMNSLVLRRTSSLFVEVLLICCLVLPTSVTTILLDAS